MTSINLPIRVKPGARNTRVGGRIGDRLVVAVRERAIEGLRSQ